MTRHLTDRLRRDLTSGAVLGGLSLLVGYGAVVVGTAFRVGGLSGLELAVLLQATSLPVGPGAAWVTYRGRPLLAPVVAAAPLLGAGAHVALVTRPSSTVVPRSGVLVLFVAGGFVATWGVLGYAGGTALRWVRRGDRVQRPELLRACSLVLAGAVLACVGYALFWSYFVVGLGDAV